VIGGGISGFATAARLQTQHLSKNRLHPQSQPVELRQQTKLRTCVLEAHSKLGGCAGYYERSVDTAILERHYPNLNTVNGSNNGFSFDVGATTFVDFDTVEGE
jgi:phytoene dehydrogenase-like protein